jgi:hypothetical protein
MGTGRVTVERIDTVLINLLGPGANFARLQVGCHIEHVGIVPRTPQAGEIGLAVQEARGRSGEIGAPVGLAGEAECLDFELLSRKRSRSAQEEQYGEKITHENTSRG